MTLSWTKRWIATSTPMSTTPATDEPQFACVTGCGRMAKYHTCSAVPSVSIALNLVKFVLNECLLALEQKRVGGSRNANLYFMSCRHTSCHVAILHVMSPYFMSCRHTSCLVSGTAIAHLTPEVSLFRRCAGAECNLARLQAHLTADVHHLPPKKRIRLGFHQIHQ